MSGASIVRCASFQWSLILCVTLSSCCQREVQARHPSPSGTKVIVVVRLNCNIGSYATEVRLQEANARDDRSPERVVASLNRSPVLQVTWVDDSSVVLFAPSGYDLHIQRKDVEGVHIDFR
jgi:hypothetical protein